MALPCAPVDESNITSVPEEPRFWGEQFIAHKTAKFSESAGRGDSAIDPVQHVCLQAVFAVLCFAHVTLRGLLARHSVSVQHVPFVSPIQHAFTAIKEVDDQLPTSVLFLRRPLVLRIHQESLVVPR